MQIARSCGVVCAAVLLAMGIGACAARTGTDSAVSGGDGAVSGQVMLEGVTWQLATLDGSAVSPLEPTGSRPALPELVFGPQGRVGGFSGVNRMFAEMPAADVRAGRVDFSKIGMTMMAGAPEAMDLERRFTAALAQATRWRIDGPTLVLTDAAGKAVLTLRAIAPAEPK
jgi:heat shock protein HslJ